MKIGEFPQIWHNANLLFIEPHYDDFYLNAYSLMKGIQMRKKMNAPKSITVVSVTHSNSNTVNGLRKLLSGKSSELIRLVELDFEDIIWHSDLYDELESCDDEELSEKIVYADNITNMLMVLAHYSDFIMVPYAGVGAHVMHRLISYIGKSMERSLGINCIYYADNPYFRKHYDAEGMFDYAHTLALYDLTDEQRASKYQLFCDGYSSQVRNQVIMERAWMLYESNELFLST
jgi:hypothetical protein